MGFKDLLYITYNFDVYVTGLTSSIFPQISTDFPIKNCFNKPLFIQLSFNLSFFTLYLVQEIVNVVGLRLLVDGTGKSP